MLDCILVYHHKKKVKTLSWNTRNIQRNTHTYINKYIHAHIRTYTHIPAGLHTYTCMYIKYSYLKKERIENYVINDISF